MKTKFVALIVLLLSAQSSYAFSDVALGVLYGVTGTVILQNIARPYQYVVPPNVGYVPQYTTPPYYMMTQQCRQVMTTRRDYYGNYYTFPETICN